MGSHSAMDDDIVNTSLSLDLDVKRANQLGATMYRSEPRKTDTGVDVNGGEGHMLWGGQYNMHVACQKKNLQFGSFEGKDACLVIFDFKFTTSLTDSHFMSAEIRIALDDCERASEISEGGDEDFIRDELIAARPRILQFQPSHFIGPKAEKSLLGKSSKESCDKIIGVLKNDRTALTLSIHDNLLIERPMIEDFSLPIIVTYASDRKFQAHIRVEADIERHAWRKPTFGHTGDPILFHPDVLKEEKRQQNAALDLDLEKTQDLKKLTRLDDYGGAFHT
jgi:hypothetical protein